jgi:hypothetical protein
MKIKEKNKSATGPVMALKPAGKRQQPSRPDAIGGEGPDRPHRERERGSAVPFCGTRSLGPHWSELASAARFGCWRTPAVRSSSHRLPVSDGPGATHEVGECEAWVD